MKKLIMFLSGLMLMVLMCGALVLAGFIYDTGSKTTIDTYFFQPDDNAIRRPGVPVDDLIQTCDEIRFDLAPVQTATKGQHVSIKVDERVRVNDKLYVLQPADRLTQK